MVRFLNVFSQFSVGFVLFFNGVRKLQHLTNGQVLIKYEHICPLANRILEKCTCINEMRCILEKGIFVFWGTLECQNLGKKVLISGQRDFL